MSAAFKIGDRVEVNAAGRELMPRAKRRTGIIIEESRSTHGCWKVKWDGLLTPTSISQSFIKREKKEPT